MFCVASLFRNGASVPAANSTAGSSPQRPTGEHSDPTGVGLCGLTD